MTSLPLSESAYVTLDGSGNGTASVGPNAHGVVWNPSSVSIKTSTAVKSPKCLMYAGRSATDDNFVDGTFTGSQNGTDLINGQVLRLGDKVFAVWSGGDAGAQATVTVSGTKDIP